VINFFDDVKMGQTMKAIVRIFNLERIGEIRNVRGKNI